MDIFFFTISHEKKKIVFYFWVSHAQKKNFACEFSTLEWADLKTEILHDTTSPSYKPTLEVEHQVLALKRMFCCLFFMTSALFLILICHFFSVEHLKSIRPLQRFSPCKSWINLTIVLMYNCYKYYCYIWLWCKVW